MVFGVWAYYNRLEKDGRPSLFAAEILLLPFSLHLTKAWALFKDLLWGDFI